MGAYLREASKYTIGSVIVLDLAREYDAKMYQREIFILVETY